MSSQSRSLFSLRGTIRDPVLGTVRGEIRDPVLGTVRGEIRDLFCVLFSCRNKRDQTSTVQCLVTVVFTTR